MTKAAVKKGSPSQDAPPSIRLFLPMNQKNARAFLTSGFLGPVRLERKQYPDLRDLCIGRMVLFSSTPPKDAWESVLPMGDETFFPGCLELNHTFFSGGLAQALLVGSLGADNEVDVRKLPTEFHCLAAPFFIPLSDHLVLHFRSERDLGEWNVREYFDLRGDDVTCAVSPLLFNGGDADGSTWREWASNLQPIHIPKDLALEADRTSGSIALLVHGAIQEKRWPLEFLVPFLQKPLAHSTILGFASAWMEACGMAIDDRASVMLDMASSILSTHDWDIDRRRVELFQRILDETAARLELPREFASFREKGTAILQGELEMKPPSEGRTGGVADVCRSILFLLQDPDPETLGGRLKKCGEHENIFGLTLILGGALCGLSGLPAHLKSRGLLAILGKLVATTLANGTQGGIGPVQQEELLEAKEVFLPDGVKKGMFVGGPTVIAFEEPLPSLMDTFEENDLETSPYREAAVLLCRIMKWESLIWSEILVGPVDHFECSHGLKKQLVIKANMSSVQVTYSVERKGFLDKLAETYETISNSVRAEVMAHLGFGESFPADGRVDGTIKSKARGRATKKGKS